jgi:hypothetical protein
LLFENAAPNASLGAHQPERARRKRGRIEAKKPAYRVAERLSERKGEERRARPCLIPDEAIREHGMINAVDGGALVETTGGSI